MMVSSAHDYQPSDVRVIATFDRYEDAQELVDQLARKGFAVDRMTIVGRDLQLIERVTGPMNVWRAALAGGVSMIPIAALFGVLFGVVFAPVGVSVLATLLYWIVVGLVAGAVVGVISYLAYGRRRRNFASLTGIFAARYEVVTDAAVADEALRLLATLAVREDAHRPRTAPPVETTH
jgi:hypothetical protein